MIDKDSGYCYYRLLGKVDRAVMLDGREERGTSMLLDQQANAFLGTDVLGFRGEVVRVSQGSLEIRMRASNCPRYG